MDRGRSQVWWGPAPHKPGPSYRPWVIISTHDHPFSHTECIAMAMTTQHHEGAILVPEEAWIQGGSERRSYISPWYVTTTKHRDLDRHQGTLSPEIVAEAVNQLHSYTPIGG